MFMKSFKVKGRIGANFILEDIQWMFHECDVSIIYKISYLAAVNGYSPPTPNPNTPKKIAKTKSKHKLDWTMIRAKCTEVHLC